MRLRPAAIRAMGRLHRGIYRLSRGRVLGKVAGMPVLLLTTTGRRTGRLRTTPLTYFEVGDELLIVGSNGGEDRGPSWYVNLQETPRATITIGWASHDVAARIADTEEHECLWPMVVGIHPGYATYARRTSRPIPLVLLSRRKENAPNR